jgi:homoserine dehydrogenase
MTDVRIAMTGFGNVGQGVAELLRDYGEEYRRRYGVRLLLTGVADRGGAAIDSTGLDPQSLLSAKRHGTVAEAPVGERDLRGDAFLERARAQVLVEAASTNFQDAEPGWGYIQGAMHRNMDLVIASKGALVLHWSDLMASARQAGLRVYFSGTVGSPLPTLELADRVLLGTRIDRIEGIVNGTANEVLAAMAEGASYEEGVQRAQESGMAETDPTLDVDGWDAAAKAVIIGNALLGGNLTLSDVRREGIRGVTVQQMLEARSRGQAIKLIATIEREKSTVTARVAPESRPLADPLGSLRGSEMGVVIHAHPLGVMTASARGGERAIPTSLTVLRDVFNLCRDRGWSS